MVPLSKDRANKPATLFNTHISLSPLPVHPRGYLEIPRQSRPSLSFLQVFAMASRVSHFRSQDYRAK